MSEPPADILRRLKPIPTYADHPTTTPHDIVGVAPDGGPCRIDVVEAAAPALLLFLSAACLGCRDLWEGLHALRAGLAGAVRLVVVTRDPGEGPSRESPEAITALAGDAPLLDGIDLVMSSAAYRDYRVTGPAVPDRRRRRRRAHRERGLGPGADAADGAAGPADRLADATRCHTLSPCLAPTERVIDMPTSRDTANIIGLSPTSPGCHGSRHRSPAGRPAHPDLDGVEWSVTIDCDCCTLRDTTACDDCVVSFLLEREPEDAVVIDADEARAMRMLERAGLVPTLRFSSRAG